MMVRPLLYAYTVGERDIGFRVVSVNRVPDHTTIARFRQEHQEESAEPFAQVLRLCTEAGSYDACPSAAGAEAA